MKKMYPSIDLFKFLFAIVVVSIHTTPFLNVSKDISWFYNASFANLAVPFFFIASGYLLYSRCDGKTDNERQQITRKYVLHILRMYLVWSVLWLPWKILNCVNTGEFSIRVILNYLKSFLLGTTGDALWYLPALAFAVIVIKVMLKYLSDKVALMIWGGGIPYWCVSKLLVCSYAA